MVRSGHEVGPAMSSNPSAALPASVPPDPNGARAEGHQAPPGWGVAARNCRRPLTMRSKTDVVDGPGAEVITDHRPKTADAPARPGRPDPPAGTRPDRAGERGPDVLITSVVNAARARRTWFHDPPGGGHRRGPEPQPAGRPGRIGSALVTIAADQRRRERMRVASERRCQAAERSAREWVACSMRRCRYNPRVASSAVARPVRTAVAKARRRIGQHSSWSMSAVS